MRFKSRQISSKVKYKIYAAFTCQTELAQVWNVNYLGSFFTVFVYSSGTA